MRNQILAASLLMALLYAGPAVAVGPTLNIVDVASGERTTVARGPKNSQDWSSIRWTRDGSALLAVTGRLGLGVRRYPVAGGRGRLLRDLDDPVDAVLSADGTLVAAGYDSGQGLRGGRGGVIVREVATGRVRARLPQVAEGDELLENPLEIVWSRDSARLAYLAQERRGLTLRIVDARSGRILRRIAARNISGLDSDAFSPSGDRLAYTSGSSGSLLQLDVATGAVRKLGRNQLAIVSWAPAGERLAASIGGGVIVSDESRHFGTPQPAGESVRAVRWSPDASALALLLQNDLTDYATAIAVMPLVPEAGKPRILVPYGKRSFGGIQWSPDGRRIAYLGWG